ncbi:amidohydrolase family protein [Embleya scabrispora]|uniref:amidohydrolase family protein n=1 Tax=Embleya scabrispora TaxID=159449 RepID=UPI00228657D6|nr:amidohydrolase family protein [Embleya scabrispora]
MRPAGPRHPRPAPVAHHPATATPPRTTATPGAPRACHPHDAADRTTGSSRPSWPGPRSRRRSRPRRLPLEFLVRKQTMDTAALYGLTDRGVIAEGKRADLNVIDPDTLTLHRPRMVHDLPAGGGRMLQQATGYLATIVAGQITRRNGQDTGARPGRLIRSAR